MQGYADDVKIKRKWFTNTNTVFLYHKIIRILFSGIDIAIYRKPVYPISLQYGAQITLPNHIQTYTDYHFYFNPVNLSFI